MPITVGIPFYNAEAYLSDAIRSVFAQTYSEWELILLDDGSTDKSRDIAMSVCDPRVRVISDGENKRLGYRLNQIITEARYGLVGRMDADDLMSPNRLQKQFEILNENPKYDLASTGVLSITREYRPIGERGGSGNDVISGRSLLLGRAPIIHASILGRRSWFLRNPYDQSCNRTEDYELWLRAFSRNDLNVFIMNEPLYFYREEENISRERMLTAYQGQRKLFRQYAHLGFDGIQVQWHILKSHVKSTMVNTLIGLGKHDWLLRRRNRDITSPSALRMLEQEIMQVLQTRVPGLD